MSTLISLINVESRLLILKKQFHPPHTFPPSMFIDFIDFFHPPLLVYCIYVLVPKNPILHVYWFCNFCTPSTFIPTSSAIREMRVVIWHIFEPHRTFWQKGTFKKSGRFPICLLRVHTYMNFICPFKFSDLPKALDSGWAIHSRSSMLAPCCTVTQFSWCHFHIKFSPCNLLLVQGMIKVFSSS